MVNDRAADGFMVVRASVTFLGGDPDDAPGSTRRRPANVSATPALMASRQEGASEDGRQSAAPRSSRDCASLMHGNGGQEALPTAITSTRPQCIAFRTRLASNAIVMISNKGLTTAVARAFRSVCEPT